jgi:hypothetical protein
MVDALCSGVAKLQPGRRCVRRTRFSGPRGVERFPHQQRHVICRPLHVHHTELADQRPSLYSWPVRAARRRHNDPAALGRYEITDIVVREVVAPGLGHRDVVPQGSDRRSERRREAVVTMWYPWIGADSRTFQTRHAACALHPEFALLGARSWRSMPVRVRQTGR